MGVLPLDVLIPLVRLHVYEAVTIEGFDLVDAAHIAESIDADVTASYVKHAFRQLSSAKEIEYEVKRNSVSGDYQTGMVFITAKGIRAVEKDIADPESLVRNYQQNGIDGASIPFVTTGYALASDRIVSFSDNEKDAVKAREAVEQLKTKIEQANELPDALAPFRDSVVAEIDALQVLINQVTVRSAIVLVFAKRLFPWIAEKAGGAAIGELAKRALTAIINWLS